MNSFQTRISMHNYDRIKTQEMTPSEMIEFLEEGALYRTFRDVLVSVYPHEDLVPRLSKGLSELTDTEYGSTQRKVRNWMQGKNTPQNRRQLFQIAFVLGLDENGASRLLANASECGIHYRNPEELVYAFSLRNGLSWSDAQELLNEMKPLYTFSPSGSSRKKTSKNNSELIYTRQLRDEFSEIHTKDELRSFFILYGPQLGEIHESAYEKFMELLGYLQDPDGGDSYESVEQIVDEYLRMSVPNTRKNAQMSYLQKVIKKNWPTESEIMRMKNRTSDVSRKTLLLLFLITEDFEFNDDVEDEQDNADWNIYYEDLIEDDPEERLEIRLNQINLFLERYGMNQLDPGNPFDCLVLYALRAEYDEADSMSANVKDALAVLFSDL